MRRTFQAIGRILAVPVGGAIVLGIVSAPRVASSQSVVILDGGYPCNAGFATTTPSPELHLNNFLNYALNNPSTVIPTPDPSKWLTATGTQTSILPGPTPYAGKVMPKPDGTAPTPNGTPPIQNIYPFNFHLASEKTGESYFVDVCIKGEGVPSPAPSPIPTANIPVTVATNLLIPDFGDYLSLAVPSMSASIVAGNCSALTLNAPLAEPGSTGCSLSLSTPCAFGTAGPACTFTLTKPFESDVVMRLQFTESAANKDRNWEPDAAQFTVSLSLPPTPTPVPILRFLSLKITQSEDRPVGGCESTIGVNGNAVEIGDANLKSYATTVAELADRKLRFMYTKTSDFQNNINASMWSIFGDNDGNNAFLTIIPNIPNPTRPLGLLYWKVPLELDNKKPPTLDPNPAYLVFEENQSYDRGCFEELMTNPNASKYGLWGRIYRWVYTGSPTATWHWGSCRIFLGRSGGDFSWCPEPGAPFPPSPFPPVPW